MKKQIGYSIEDSWSQLHYGQTVVLLHPYTQNRSAKCFISELKTCVQNNTVLDPADYTLYATQKKQNNHVTKLVH